MGGIAENSMHSSSHRSAHTSKGLLKKLFLRALLVLSLAGHSAHGAKVYRCPGPNEKPLVLSESSGAQITLPYGDSDRVCILAHVHATFFNSDKELANINLYSHKDDYHLVPVARSYHQFPWQNSAGKFADQPTIDNCDDDSTPTPTCTITLPDVDESLRLPDGKFVLMGLEHKLKNFSEELSRFFARTTFGPTRDMISTFQQSDRYSNDLGGMASWLRDNINEPATLHRVYWRERIHHATTNNYGRFMMRKPCDAHSIWYDYAFDEKDWNGAAIQLENWNGKQLIKVNGVPRTLLDTPLRMQGTTVNFPSGTYKIHTALFGSYPGGNVKLQGGPIDAFIEGGNPSPIKLPPAILNDSRYNFHQVILPGNSKQDQAFFDHIPPIKTRYHELGKEGYRLKVDIGSGNGCDALRGEESDRGEAGNVVGKLPNYGSTNTILRHGANMALKQNTVEDPCIGEECGDIRVKMHPNIEDSCVVDESNGGGSNTEIRCGSHGEVINKRDMDPKQTNAFMYVTRSNIYYWDKAMMGKIYVWHNIAQKAEDQFRQRVSWALSDYFPINAGDLSAGWRETEMFVNYYDIFVRNAFGNMRDVLKDISFSPLMGRYLTFVNSRSPYYKERFAGIKASLADENYAREIMQLFTIGLDILNRDGTPIKKDGLTVPTYHQRHVRSLARAWTGFNHAILRYNIEQYLGHPNRIDNMWIEGVQRDPFPKIDTTGGYIGDGYPLCNDLPAKHWLRKGARYRFRGSNPRPELGEQDNYHYYNIYKQFRADMTLEEGSPLYAALCDANDSGMCNFSINVVLDSHIECLGKECKVEMPRVVKIGDVFYEYVRPPCVNLPFSTDVSSVVGKNKEFACAHKYDNESVQMACCKGVNSNTLWHTCSFSGSRVSYDENTFLCGDLFDSGAICDGDNQKVEISKEGVLYPNENGSYDEFSCVPTGGQVTPLYWQGSDCNIKMKVNVEGQIAIVHKSETEHDATYLLAVDQESPFWFDVIWPETGSFPAPYNNCNGLDACEQYEDYCLCDVEVSETQIFSAKPSNDNEIINSLKVGHPSPDMFDDGSFTEEETVSGYTIYHPGDSSLMTKDTFFKVVQNGKVMFYKNMIPNVTIPGESGITLRNPPQFSNLINPVSRDAFYETEAVIDHFFYHPNSPTYIAIEFIKRLGTSNPSPDYVKKVDQSYREGIFETNGVVFGDGNYGNLEALFASIIFHRDATTVAVDADPFAGSLREPTLSYHAFMRAMEMKASEYSPIFEIWFYKAGEEAFYSPSVFGFFDSKLEPDGTFNSAGMVSAEATVYNPIRGIRMMNALTSLIENGLTLSCGGFGPDTTAQTCPLFPHQPHLREQSRAELTYIASGETPEDIIDELAMLLTGGRLNYYARKVLAKELVNGSQNDDDSLKLVQRLIAMSPEFHSTGIVQPSLRGREGHTPNPPLDGTDYKAVVYLYLSGGMDGFNALMPHSNCNNGKDMYAEYARIRAYNAVPKTSMRQIAVPQSTQVCNNFGIHPSLEHAHQLYQRGDLAFISNTGLLTELCDDRNWEDVTTFQTGAHNLGRIDTLRMDVHKSHPGKGVGGRLLDALKNQGYSVNGVTVSRMDSAALESYDSPHLLMSETGKFETYNPMEWVNNKDEILHSLTNTTALGSSRFSDLWGNNLRAGIEENDWLKSVIGDVDFGNSYSPAFSVIERMIETAPQRGVEREIFYNELFGFDTHFNMGSSMYTLFGGIDNILKNFEAKMTAKGRWDDVTIILMSDFGRALAMNGGNGTDHGWGNNLFVAGGSVKGGQVLGTYPDDLTNENPYIMGGRLIPTTPLDSIWNSVSQWMGVSSEEGLDVIAPNRKSFPSSYLWDESVLFE